MLVDKYSRSFSYLRLSITDLCNFSCQYCLPDNMKFKIKNYLSVNEIYNLVICLSELGVKKVRLTGGEPTVRKDFLLIGKKISMVPGIESLVFTTNGYKLSNIALDVLKAGFQSVNVSLDTMDCMKFSVITGRDYFYRVFKGILFAMKVGLSLKINIVLSKFFSFKDFEDFYSLLKYKNITIRFIDQMETNLVEKSFKNRFNVNHLLQFLKKNKWINGEKINIQAGPAQVYVNENFLGKIGIINPYSTDFCFSCNRLRVSAVGDLFLCLFGGTSYPIRSYLQSSKQKNELKIFLKDKVKLKLPSHKLFNRNFGLINSFSSIGG